MAAVSAGGARGGNSKGSSGGEDMQPMVQKGLQATKRGILRASEGSDTAFGSLVEATEGRRPDGEGAKLGAAYLPAEDPRYPGLRLNPYRNHSFFQRSPTLMRRQEGKRLYYEAVAAGGHPDDGGGGAGGTTNGPFGRGAEVKTGKARRHPPRTPHRRMPHLQPYGLPPMELPRWSQGSQWASLVS